MTPFDPQIIWTGAGLSAGAVVVGLILGFLQSALPFISASGDLRNYVLIALSAAVVLLAGLTSGHTLSEPDAATNILGGILVFIGLYNASKNAHGAGEAVALRTVDAATPITTAVPDPK